MKNKIFIPLPLRLLNTGIQYLYIYRGCLDSNPGVHRSDHKKETVLFDI